MDAVQQLNSTLAGLYEIEREIGSGGMASVYVDWKSVLRALERGKELNLDGREALPRS